MGGRWGAAKKSKGGKELETHRLDEYNGHLCSELLGPALLNALPFILLIIVYSSYSLNPFHIK
jgi:hypothetical protein